MLEDRLVILMADPEITQPSILKRYTIFWGRGEIKFAGRQDDYSDFGTNFA
ncbi:MAG: hypothetical protein CM15mP12_7190 [Gammaproteobacteria bacterium]|nr:MAG: hypothetical protein CM15mP12_7190 [Gammaproteobacteria bacterium]